MDGAGLMRAMSFALPEEVADLRDLVSRWARERLAPMAGRIDRDNLFPPGLWPEMGGLGLLGLTVPEEFGGTGLGYLAHVVAVEEIARASPLWDRRVAVLQVTDLRERTMELRCLVSARNAGEAFALAFARPARSLLRTCVASARTAHTVVSCQHQQQHHDRVHPSSSSIQSPCPAQHHGLPPCFT